MGSYEGKCRTKEKLTNEVNRPWAVCGRMQKNGDMIFKN